MDDQRENDMICDTWDQDIDAGSSKEIGVQIVSITETRVWIESDILGNRHVMLQRTGLMDRR